MSGSRHIAPASASVRAAVLAASALLAGPAAAQAATGRASTAPSGPDPAGATIVLEATRTGRTPGCLPVRRFTVRGVVFVDADELRRKLEPLAFRCVGGAEIKAILAAINDTYADRGFVTTQGYLPDQDIPKSGAVLINVIAGRIEKLIYREGREEETLGLADRMARGWRKVVDAKGPWSTLAAASELLDRLDDPLDDFQLLPRGIEPNPKLWTSSVTGPGDVLEMDRVQHGIDQINRVASSRAQAKLTPGDAPATSTVVIENTPTDSFRLLAGYEINGASLNRSGETVSNRLRLDVAKDNLIGVNDAWRLSFAGGIDSNEVRGGFAVPFRLFTLSLDGGYSESISEISPGAELFSRTGNLTGTVGFLLRRDRTRQTLLDTSLAWRTNERYVNGTALTPQTISVARLGVSETRTFESVQLSYGAGIGHGLPALGATRDDPAGGPSSPRAQFWKIDGQASVAKSFAEIGVLRFDASAQWSNQPLYSDDQLVLGSATTVRGFTNNAARVDRGALLRGEFAPVLSVAALLGNKREEWGFLSESLSSLQPYVFADYGFGRDLANREDLQRAGIGAGLRYRHGRINLDVSLAEPVFRAGGPKPRAWQSPEAYLTLSIKLL